MLKGISPLISPELLKILCEMGHGDRIVIGDGNCPAESLGQSAYVVRCDGQNVPALLEAILALMPLDSYVEHPVTLMQVTPGDQVETPIWDTFREIVAKNDSRGADAIVHLPRAEFYDVCRNAYAIVATSETALYANIVLQKGVVIE